VLDLKPGTICTVLKPSANSYENRRVYNPTLIKVDNKIAMLYRAEGKDTGTGVLCLAQSFDGITFERYEKNPVLVPDMLFDSKGCEDPRIVKFKEKFYLLYVGNGSENSRDNICLAVSDNLVDWQKRGKILKAKYLWESNQIKAGVLVPEKINGKYWMYYLGQDRPWHCAIGLAFSENFSIWEQLDTPVLSPRNEYWDSYGVEPGCSVVLPQGILLIYNGWDTTCQNKGGWALFDKTTPAKLIARCNAPLISMKSSHVFVTGLIQFKSNWLLYWGANDEWIDSACLYITNDS